jgi:hypothetical protein
MNILAQAKDLYEKCGIDMNRDIAAYCANGYVFITPDSFLLGKAVNSKSDIHPQDQWNVEDADAWYVNMAVGDVKDFISKIPYPLPLVGWMRQLKSQPVRWYDFKRIIRRK